MNVIVVVVLVILFFFIDNITDFIVRAVRKKSKKPEELGDEKNEAGD